MEKIKELLELMALHGGKIVCTASLSVRQINQSKIVFTKGPDNKGYWKYSTNK